MEHSDGSFAERKRIFFPEPPWPQPIQEMLDTCREPETYSFYHGQLLYSVGTLLRALVGFLASRYLYDEEANSARLNACIAADLRRPTYGNLLAFLRACVGTENVEWGCLNEIVRAVGRALKLRHPGLVGVPKDMNLLDALIRYRNGVAHGSGALNERECQRRTPPLEASVCAVLEELHLLRECVIETGASPRLLVVQEQVPLFPLAYEDPHPVLGIMEGYDTERRRLRFVCVQKEWETGEPWSVWAKLLQRRGLLACDWDELDEEWLGKRAVAFLPQRYRLPAALILPAVLSEDLMLCAEIDGTLPVKDADFAVAVLCREMAGRFCFAIEPSDKIWAMDPCDGLSRLVGAAVSVCELPEEHPLGHLLGCVTLIATDGRDGGLSLNWKTLERDFPGLKVLRLRKVGGEQQGFSGPGELLPALFDAMAAENGHSLTWNRLSQATRRWVDGFEKAVFVASNPHLARGGHPDPVRVWREYLTEALPHDMQSGFIDQLVDACEAATVESDAPVLRPLADLGVLRINADGAWSFGSEWARAALFGVALNAAQGRQLKRFANRPPLPVTPELASELHRVCRAERYQPPLGTEGGQALLAFSAANQKPLPTLKSMTAHELRAFIKSCALLVSWGRPDAVDILIQTAWQAISAQNLVADEQSIQVASAVRRHGTPALAEELFAALADSQTEAGLRAKHELAGVLRDRGAGDDRLRAVRLYEEVLAATNLSVEQRVRTLCGAAENLMWLEEFEEAHGLLRKALDCVPDDQLRLRALVQHRLATTCMHQGAREAALTASEEAVRLLGGQYHGAFAARCLDLHSLVLIGFGEYKKAEEHLARALEIKRAMGDRLGLQKSLLQLSLLREKTHASDASTPALEALELAERSGDLLGQKFLHRRLATLFRHDAATMAHHLERVRQISDLLEGSMNNARKAE